MRALDIPPHSPSSSRLAVTVLALIAGFALASGYLRQVVSTAPASIPAGGSGPAMDIPEATPAPEPTLQVALAAPHRVRLADTESAPTDASEAAPPAATNSAPVAEASASATGPAAPAQPPEPAAPNDAPGA